MADLTPVMLRDPSSPLSAVYVPGAGMIATSLSDGGIELLGQRRGLDAYLSAGKTMGIPLLYPWANRLSAKTYDVDGETVTLTPDAYGVRPDNNGLPIHGLLAAYPRWRAQQVSDQKLTAELDFGAQDELHASFPFPHLVELTVELSNHTLTVSTTVTPTTDKAVPFVYGYHPYLQLPDVPRHQWQVELPTMRQLILDDTGIPTGATAETPANRGTVGRHGVRRWFRSGRRRGGIRGVRRRTQAGGAVRPGLPGRTGVRSRRRDGHLLRTNGRAHRRIAPRRLPIRAAG